MINVLVIEDEENIRKIISKVLSREGYHVFEASSAEEGLDIIDKNLINLIVLDLALPKMDGYEFTKMLRESQDNLPILMVSAKQLPEDKKKGFLVGTDDYMTKPVDEDEMILRIKALLRRAKIVSERKIVIGDVVLEYDELSVKKQGSVIELPQKEFLLLYKLLSYPGKIFTRIQLMDEIWGTSSGTGWETVTVHIGRLRKKFEEWDEFEIQSVRGLGYKAVKKV